MTEACGGGGGPGDQLPGRKEACPQVEEGRGASLGALAARCQVPAARTRSHLPFLPCTHPLVASQPALPR